MHYVSLVVKTLDFKSWSEKDHMANLLKTRYIFHVQVALIHGKNVCCLISCTSLFDELIEFDCIV